MQGGDRTRERKERGKDAKWRVRQVRERKKNDCPASELINNSPCLSGVFKVPDGSCERGSDAVPDGDARPSEERMVRGNRGERARSVLADAGDHSNGSLRASRSERRVARLG